MNKIQKHKSLVQSWEYFFPALSGGIIEYRFYQYFLL